MTLRRLLAPLCAGVLTMSCGFSADTGPDNWVEFSTPSYNGYETRFVGHSPIALSLGDEAKLRSTCPTLTRGHLLPQSKSFQLLTVQGKGLHEHSVVGAILKDGTLAQISPQWTGTSLEIPVACDDCQIIFGVQVNHRMAACVGSRYSLSINEAKLSSP